MKMATDLDLDYLCHSLTLDVASVFLQLKRQKSSGEEVGSGAASTSQAQPADPAAAHVNMAEGIVPKGWLDCPCVGDPIGFLIPSKTPISAAYNSRIPEGKRYTPQMVVQAQKELKREIGLVVDLTRSKVYYSPRQWEELGIQYVNIRCQGRPPCSKTASPSSLLPLIDGWMWIRFGPKTLTLSRSW